MDDDDWLDLPGLHRELRSRYHDAPPYARLWRGAVEGLFPARRRGRVWGTSGADLPAVACAFGLRPRQKADTADAAASMA